MELSRYIRELLYIHDCVILPDFGGFVANYKSAQIKEHQFSFIPPSKEISFNVNLSKNDGLLISHIATVELQSYSDVKTRLEQYVKEIKNSLLAGREHILDGIGAFQYDNEQNLVYEPFLSTNLLIESFGLSSFQFPAIEIEATTNKFDKKVIPIDTGFPSLFKVAVAVAACLVLALFPYKTVVDNVNPSFAQLFQPTIELEDLNPDELMNNPSSLQKALDQLTTTKMALYYSEPSIEEVSTESKNTIAEEHSQVSEKQPITSEESFSSKPSVIEKIKQRKEKYYLIAASFANRTQAKSYMGEFSKKGYKPELLAKQDGRHRISIGCFTERDKADLELKKVKSHKVPVWILTVIK